ncbi:MAG: TlpA family protein disulfide reductase [bacterium]
MKKSTLFFIIVFFQFTLLSCSKREEFTAELAMQSDAMAIVNYYQPKRIILSAQPQEAGLTLPNFSVSQPLFGVLMLGDSPDSLITLALDETDSGSYLYIDRNNNEDLTDDGDPGWDEDKSAYRSKEALVDVTYKDSNQKAPVPYPITFYRSKNRTPDSIVAFRNGYREGTIALKDTSYRIALLDDDFNGLFTEKGAIIIDTNRDGHLSGDTDSEEYYSLHEPFNLNGVTYKMKHVSPAGDFITLTIADTMVFPKTSLIIGTVAPSFQTRSIDGQSIDLLNYRNKVVLLDFWATWCKPWEEALPELKRIHERYQARGLEIIGVNLDYDLETLSDFVQENRIPWQQVSTGKGWDMALVNIYKVEAIPKNFLLDRNGVIRYKNLHGNTLRLKISELLNEPEIGN